MSLVFVYSIGLLSKILQNNNYTHYVIIKSSIALETGQYIVHTFFFFWSVIIYFLDTAV